MEVITQLLFVRTPLTMGSQAGLVISFRPHGRINNGFKKATVCITRLRLFVKLKWTYENQYIKL